MQKHKYENTNITRGKSTISYHGSFECGFGAGFLNISAFTQKSYLQCKVHLDAIRKRGRRITSDILTQYMHIRPSADRGHTAAAEYSLALVEAGVAHHGAEDGQPAVEVAQAAGHQHAVLTP